MRTRDGVAVGPQHPTVGEGVGVAHAAQQQMHAVGRVAGVLRGMMGVVCSIIKRKIPPVYSLQLLMISHSMLPVLTLIDKPTVKPATPVCRDRSDPPPPPRPTIPRSMSKWMYRHHSRLQQTRITC